MMGKVELIEENGEEYIVSKEQFMDSTGFFTELERWKNGDFNYHREKGPAYIIRESKGTTYYWLQKDIFHREDGPAIERYDGEKFWYKNGKLHREDGPAHVYPNQEADFWLEGKFLSQKSFLKAQQDKIICIKGKPYLIDGRPIKGIT